MSFRRKHYDPMEMQHIQTLGQKWAGQNDRIRDYACNVFADKLAILDLEIDKLETLPEKSRNQELLDAVKVIREGLRQKGEALWIMKADVLTNLGVKVGKTGVREFRGKKDIGTSNTETIQ